MEKCECGREVERLHRVWDGASRSNKSVCLDCVDYYKDGLSKPSYGFSTPSY